MASTDLLVDPQAQALLLCLQESLMDHPGFPMPPGVVSIRAGERAVTGVTFDGADECRCGYAWVRADAVFPTTEGDFPGLSTDFQPECGITWAARFELGIARCAPDTTSYVSPEQWQGVHRNLMIDWACLRQAICCYLARSGNDAPFQVSIGEITPSGPEGLCLRSTVEITVLLGECNGC